jgi:hypothetical protein
LDLPARGLIAADAEVVELESLVSEFRTAIAAAEHELGEEFAGLALGTKFNFGRSILNVEA